MSDTAQLQDIVGLYFCEEDSPYGGRSTPRRQGKVEAKLGEGLYLCKLRSDARITLNIRNPHGVYRYYENQEEMQKYLDAMKKKAKEQEELQKKLQEAGQQQYALAINTPLEPGGEQED